MALRKELQELGMTDTTFDDLLESCGADSMNPLTIMLQHFYHVWETDLVEMSETGQNMPKHCANESLGVFREHADAQENVAMNELSSYRVRILSLKMASELSSKVQECSEQALLANLSSREEEERDAKNNVLRLETKLSEEQAINSKINKKLVAMEKAMRKYEVELDEQRQQVADNAAKQGGVKSHALQGLQDDYDKQKTCAEEASKENVELKRENTKLEGHISRLETEHAAYQTTQGTSLNDWFSVLKSVFSGLRPHTGEGAPEPQDVRIHEIDADSEFGIRTLVGTEEPSTPSSSNGHAKGKGLAGYSAGGCTLLPHLS